MITLLAGTALLSVFHALIPSHWLPVLAVSKRQHWSVRQTLWITLLAGLAHVLSTVILGGIFAALGGTLAKEAEGLTLWFAPVVLVGMGVFYIYQHHYRRCARTNNLCVGLWGWRHKHCNNTNSRICIAGLLQCNTYCYQCNGLCKYTHNAGLHKYF